MTLLRVCVALLLAVATGCAADPARVRADTALPPGHGVSCEGDFDVPPRFVSGKSPLFPASTLQNPDFIEDRKIRHLPLHWQVTTRFDVRADGSTSNVRSTRTDPPFFATHTNAAIARWRFEPATRDGAPASAACSYLLEFSIRT